MIFSPCEKPVRQEERPYDEAGLRLARSAQKDKRKKYQHKYNGKCSNANTNRKVELNFDVELGIFWKLVS